LFFLAEAELKLDQVLVKKELTNSPPLERAYTAYEGVKVLKGLGMREKITQKTVSKLNDSLKFLLPPKSVTIRNN
jgi:hypothetical protein